MRCQFIMVKIKPNAFLSVREKILSELNIITYDTSRIKQFRIVESQGCYMGAYVSGESMTMKALKKINAILQFLYRQNEFLNPKLRRFLCNSLIQPYFNYACISRYLLVSKK